MRISKWNIGFTVIVLTLMLGAMACGGNEGVSTPIVPVAQEPATETDEPVMDAEEPATQEPATEPEPGPPVDQLNQERKDRAGILTQEWFSLNPQESIRVAHQVISNTLPALAGVKFTAAYEDEYAANLTAMIDSISWTESGLEVAVTTDGVLTFDESNYAGTVTLTIPWVVLIADVEQIEATADVDNSKAKLSIARGELSVGAESTGDAVDPAIDALKDKFGK